MEDVWKVSLTCRKSRQTILDSLSVKSSITFRVETGSVKLKASWQILPQSERLLSLLSDPAAKCP